MFKFFCELLHLKKLLIDSIYLLWINIVSVKPFKQQRSIRYSDTFDANYNETNVPIVLQSYHKNTREYRDFSTSHVKTRIMRKYCSNTSNRYTNKR